MNWRMLSIGFTFVLTLTTSPLLLADGEENGIAHRVAALEQQMTTLMAELERESPDTDLTGKTYCAFAQGIWLNAGSGSAGIFSNQHSFRLDFTSTTQVTATARYDLYSGIVLPDYIMVDGVDGSGIGEGTYTVIGNKLTLTFGGEVAATILITPDARVLLTGYFERSAGGGRDWWETVMVVGIQATSCD